MPHDTVQLIIAISPSLIFWALVIGVSRYECCHLAQGVAAPYTMSILPRCPSCAANAPFQSTGFARMPSSIPSRSFVFALLQLVAVGCWIGQCAQAQSNRPVAGSAADSGGGLRQVNDLTGWSDGQFVFKGPQPSFVKVWPQGLPEHPLEFSFNSNATQVMVHAPSDEALASEITRRPLTMLLADQSVVHPDGVAILSALDAQVVGQRAALESHPGSHRIGFWNRAEDYVTWDFAIPPGDYHAELVYSRAPKTGTEVSIIIGEQKFSLPLERTGSWYRYRTVPLGEVHVSNESKTHVEVRVDKIINGGVMNLKAIVLTPIRQAE